jgi:hypothetical protein
MNTIDEFEIYRSSKENSQHLLNDKLSFLSHIIYNIAIDIIGGSDRGSKGTDKDNMSV